MDDERLEEHSVVLCAKRSETIRKLERRQTLVYLRGRSGCKCG
jgi:hypothetical protein